VTGENELYNEERYDRYISSLKEIISLIVIHLK
jgi:hypothetical protein